VSVTKNEDDIGVHFDFMRRFCALQHEATGDPSWRVEREWEGIGESGLDGDCPTWLEMLGVIDRLPAAARPSRVVFYRLDRVARNLSFLAEVLAFLGAKGVRVVIATDPGLDPFSPTGRMMATIHGGFAEKESLDKVEKMPTATRYSYTVRGHWPHRPPMPYKPGGDRGKELRGVPQLVPDDPQVPLWREGIERIARGEPAEAVYGDLVKRGLGCSRSSFYRTIRHPALGGEIWVGAPEWRKCGKRRDRAATREWAILRHPQNARAGLQS
jgi:DNA invertase Pin-like site-specific DNA recombinase